MVLNVASRYPLIWAYCYRGFSLLLILRVDKMGLVSVIYSAKENFKNKYNIIVLNIQCTVYCCTVEYDNFVTIKNNNNARMIESQQPFSFKLACCVGYYVVHH